VRGQPGYFHHGYHLATGARPEPHHASICPLSGIAAPRSRDKIHPHLLRLISAAPSLPGIRNSVSWDGNFVRSRKYVHFVAAFRWSTQPEHSSDVQPHGGLDGQSADHEVKVHWLSAVSRRLAPTDEDPPTLDVQLPHSATAGTVSVAKQRPPASLEHDRLSTQQLVNVCESRQLLQVISFILEIMRYSGLLIQSGPKISHFLIISRLKSFKARRPMTLDFYVKLKCKNHYEIVTCYSIFYAWHNMWYHLLSWGAKRRLYMGQISVNGVISPSCINLPLQATQFTPKPSYRRTFIQNNLYSPYLFFLQISIKSLSLFFVNHIADNSSTIHE